MYMRLLVRAMLKCCPLHYPVVQDLASSRNRYTISVSYHQDKCLIQVAHHNGPTFRCVHGPYTLPKPLHFCKFVGALFRDDTGSGRFVTLDNGNLAVLGGRRKYNESGDCVNFTEIPCSRISVETTVHMSSNRWYGVVPAWQPRQRIERDLVLVWKGDSQRWGACSVHQIDNLLRGVYHDNHLYIA